MAIDQEDVGAFKEIKAAMGEKVTLESQGTEVVLESVDK